MHNGRTSACHYRFTFVWEFFSIAIYLRTRVSKVIRIVYLTYSKANGKLAYYPISIPFVASTREPMVIVFTDYSALETHMLMVCVDIVVPDIRRG